MPDTSHEPARESVKRARNSIFDAAVWPMLFQAPRLSLRPARLGLAFFMLLLLGLIGKLPTLWLDNAGPFGVLAGLGGEGLADLREGVLRLRPDQIVQGVREVFIGAPLSAARQFPWSFAALLVPFAIVLGIFGGAIARSAAVEAARRDPIPWTAALGFALSRWAAMAMSTLLPLLVLGLLIGGVAVAGWLLLSWKVLQVAGGGLFFLALLAGLLGVLLVAGYLLGLPMLTPALACEGSDAIDSVQRAYAYVFGRTARVVLSVLLLIVQAVLVGAVLALLARGVVSASAWASTLLLPDELAATLRGAAMKGEVPPEASWSLRAACRAMAFWSRVPGLLVSAFVASYWYSAGTLLYLTVRHAADGQDPEELWQPGSVRVFGTESAGGGAAGDADDDE